MSSSKGVTGTKYGRELVNAAKKRGWTYLRTGTHNQLILEYPTGARFTVLCTPGAAPPIKDMIKKLSGLERSSTTKIQTDLLEYLCDLHGIKPDESKVVHVSLTVVVQEFLGNKHATRTDIQRMTRAIAHSDRVWMVGFSKRGISDTPTPRLVLGRNASLNEEQLKLVQSFPQVNDVFPGKSVEETRKEMDLYVSARGWDRNVNNTYSHKQSRLFGLRLNEAFEEAQKMPVVGAQNGADPYVDPNAPQEQVETKWAETNVPAAYDEGKFPVDAEVASNPDHGVVPVVGEEPVPSLAEQNEKAAQMIGLPIALVEALRDYLKIDNKNMLSGMEMVRESLSIALAQHRMMGKALEDLGEAIELIKVEG